MLVLVFGRVICTSGRAEYMRNHNSFCSNALQPAKPDSRAARVVWLCSAHLYPFAISCLVQRGPFMCMSTHMCTLASNGGCILCALLSDRSFYVWQTGNYICVYEISTLPCSYTKWLSHQFVNRVGIKRMCSMFITRLG